MAMPPLKLENVLAFINIKNNTKTFEEYRKWTRRNVGTFFKLTANIY